eukprot:66576-Pleurochrysis_carterae.AAC.1
MGAAVQPPTTPNETAFVCPAKQFCIVLKEAQNTWDHSTWQWPNTFKIPSRVRTRPSTGAATSLNQMFVRPTNVGNGVPAIPLTASRNLTPQPQSLLCLLPVPYIS